MPASRGRPGGGDLPSAARRRWGAPLPRSFYSRDVRAVARDLIGRVLVRAEARGVCAGRLVEVEAYGGPRDPASHARPGLTARNASMFGPPGHAYVYFTYGMHHCLNVVTGPPRRASAVLIRALEPLAGMERMRRRRGAVSGDRLASGPGCVAQALGLDRRHDGLDMTREALWVGRRASRRDGRRLACSTRVGIRAGRGRPWRWFLLGHPCVSGPRSAPGGPHRGWAGRTPPGR